MKKLLTISCIFISVLLTAQIPGGVPEGLEELYLQNNAGFQEFKVLNAKSAIGTGIYNIAAQKIPLPLLESITSQGTSVLVIEEDFMDPCPENNRVKSGVTMWVLKLDENDTFNSFTTSVKDKKATFHIRGMMDKYVPGPNFCQDMEMVKAESGLGALTANFSTFIHTNPRAFQVMEQAGMETEKMKQLKAVQKFWNDNLIGYLSYMKEYQATPHISRIGGNATPDPPPPAQREKVKAGTEDGDQKEGWFSERDGYAIAKHALDALSNSINAMQLADNGAKLFGAALKYGGSVKKTALNFVASAANMAGMDVSSMSENELYKTMDDMVAALAKVNEKYAKQGDPIAKQLQQKAKIPVNDKRFYFEAVDAGRMLYQLNDLLNSLDEIEEQLGKLDFPEGAVSGSIYGPGLNQNITSLKPEGQPIIQIASSTALEESKKMADPKMMEQLKSMGYNIPDEILNMNIDAIIAEVQSKAEGKIDIDINEPVFNGLLSTTHTITLQGNTFQNFQILFAISSPNEPNEEENWWDDATIFDSPSEADEEKPKSKVIYVATNGLDSNPGTLEAPFATIQKALDEAHTLRQNKNSVTVIIKDGIYKQTAEVNWTTPLGLPPLTIKAQNKHQAIFVGTDPVSSSINWTKNTSTGYFTAIPPLHPNQWTFSPGGNPMENQAPVLSVNGNKLIHLPTTLPNGLNGMYSFGASQVIVAPPQGVENLNDAQIDVSTRKFAFKILGGDNIQITDLKLVNYPYPAPQNTPGIFHNGNVQVMGCKFE
ncbi:hypothetical protein [Paucihalobacter sp.]|uniref:hypothetical protein n=1 Tax=Paucihalobacter sp. TaxID=2850405 RepID=UPI003D161305